MSGLWWVDGWMVGRTQGFYVSFGWWVSGWVDFGRMGG